MYGLGFICYIENIPPDKKGTDVCSILNTRKNLSSVRCCPKGLEFCLYVYVNGVKASSLSEYPTSWVLSSFPDFLPNGQTQSKSACCRLLLLLGCFLLFFIFFFPIHYLVKVSFRLAQLHPVWFKTSRFDLHQAQRGSKSSECRPAPLHVLMKDICLGEGSREESTMGAGTGAIPVPSLCGQLDGGDSVPRPAPCGSPQPCLGQQPHQHDRLHHPHRLLPLCCHHAAPCRLDQIPPNTSPPMPGLPLVQSHRGMLLLAALDPESAAHTCMLAWIVSPGPMFKGW